MPPLKSAVLVNTMLAEVKTNPTSSRFEKHRKTIMLIFFTKEIFRECFHVKGQRQL